MNSKGELRRDAVSRDWVLVAPERDARPHHFSVITEKPTPKNKCPFEDPQKAGNGEALLWYSRAGRETNPVRRDWILQVIRNKYPAVVQHNSICPVYPSEGLHRKMQGVGFHEVVVPRSHSKFISQMSPEEAELIIRAYQDRFLVHAENKCTRYVLVFHNHGQAAGASIWHPHSQIIALPIIPPDLYRSVSGSERYRAKYKHCVHCKMIRIELKNKDRFIYRNKAFAVIAPFASRVSFEMRIFPIRHEANFQNIEPGERILLADALVSALRSMRKVLGNPAFNFFIHTAPVVKGRFDFYHWHLEILPKTAHFAGVELGSGIEVVSMSPERAALLLRKAIKYQ